MSALKTLRHKLLHFSQRPVGGSCFLPHCWGTCVGALASQQRYFELESIDIRDVAGRGWNGAAFAAFGEMGLDFLGAEVPLPDRRDGVKLGESTLNRFLLLSIVISMLVI